MSAEDIQKVARRILTSPPALAARGNIKALPDLGDVQKALANDGRLPGSKRMSLFR